MPERPDVPPGAVGPINSTINTIMNGPVTDQTLDITRGAIVWQDSPDADEAQSLDDRPTAAPGSDEGGGRSDGVLEAETDAPVHATEADGAGTDDDSDHVHADATQDVSP